MFTSRGPRDIQEVEDCVALFMHSPFWASADPSLTKRKVAGCWEKLLQSGVGLIDIFDNTKYHKQLKDEKKSRNDPHYKHGFSCVSFVCYVSYFFAKKILDPEILNQDVLPRLISECLAHLDDPSNASPLTPLANDGSVKENLIGLSLTLYHSNALFNLDDQVKDGAEFLRRMEKSVYFSCNGYKHDAWFALHLGEELKEQTKKFGYGEVHDYSSNENESVSSKGKFILAVARNQELASQLNLPPETVFDVQHDMTRNLFLFRYEIEDRKVSLAKEDQHICYLLLLGWDAKQICKHFYGKNVTSETIKHIRNVQRSASRRLVDKGYSSAGTGTSLPVSSLKMAMLTEAAHEFRQFMFSIYPWPESLPSRSL